MKKTRSRKASAKARAGGGRRPASRARARADARLRRRRGEAVIDLRLVAFGLGSLLALGLLGGALLGVYLDRSGVVDRLAGWQTPADARGASSDPSPEARPARPSAADALKPAAALDRALAAAQEDRSATARGRLAAAPPEPSGETSKAAPRPPAPATETSAEPSGPPLDAAAAGLASLVARPAALRAMAEGSRRTDRLVRPEPQVAGLPEQDDPHVVYDEPAATREPASRSSGQALDGVLDERGLGAAADVPERRAAPAAWQRYAVQVADVGQRPMIALVLDDLGLNRPNTRRAIALPAPLTLAFMTYAEHIEGMLADARAGGHELLVHVPMEPSDPAWNPGINVLTANLAPEEIARRLAWGLGRFEGYVGINNHMGSRFSTSLPGMGRVMEELKKRGLLFLDSKTASASVGPGLAERMGVPYVERDIFIDNEHEDRAAIRRQLEALEALARERGFAVGIGHPHQATLDVLEDWLPAVRQRGSVLVPISAVVRRRIELARAAGHAG